MCVQQIGRDLALGRTRAQAAPYSEIQHLPQAEQDFAPSMLVVAIRSGQMSSDVALDAFSFKKNGLQILCDHLLHKL